MPFAAFPPSNKTMLSNDDTVINLLYDRLFYSKVHPIFPKPAVFLVAILKIISCLKMSVILLIFNDIIIIEARFTRKAFKRTKIKDSFSENINKAINNYFKGVRFTCKLHFTEFC